MIKNLAVEEGKDPKAFLKQQPFAKPGKRKRCLSDSIKTTAYGVRECGPSTLFFYPFFCVSENVRKVVSETYMLLKSKLTSTLQSMALFLANKDTEYILFKPVKVSRLSSCDHFRRRPNTAEEYPSKSTRTPHLPSFNFDRFLKN